MLKPKTEKNILKKHLLNHVMKNKLKKSVKFMMFTKPSLHYSNQ